MDKIASPQKVQIYQQTHFKQSFTKEHGLQKQAQEGAFKTTTKSITVESVPLCIYKDTPAMRIPPLIRTHTLSCP
jgi:hypothetical protein